MLFVCALYILSVYDIKQKLEVTIKDYTKKISPSPSTFDISTSDLKTIGAQEIKLKELGS